MIAKDDMPFLFAEFLEFQYPKSSSLETFSQRKNLLKYEPISSTPCGHARRCLPSTLGVNLLAEQNYEPGLGLGPSGAVPRGWVRTIDVGYDTITVTSGGETFSYVPPNTPIPDSIKTRNKEGKSFRRKVKKTSIFSNVKFWNRNRNDEQPSSVKSASKENSSDNLNFRFRIKIDTEPELPNGVRSSEQFYIVLFQ
uniref:Uncharacterized protein n=1 Tax=Romanomermis culicivorax TaxID=13658 RepID=A0A915K8T8_ROMCU